MGRGAFSTTFQADETHPASSITIHGDGQIDVALFVLGREPLRCTRALGDVPAGSFINGLKWLRDQALTENGVAKT